jgi:quinolinate synthase
VNSTAACKAEMDVCCTSSNAVKIVKSLDSKTVLFVPDKNLGSYVAGECKDKKIILWDGFCPVHQAITRNQIVRLKENHKGAKILAHPECRDEVLEIADVIGSTEKMLTYCRQSDDEEFVVATEIGMCHRLEKECPGKKFYFPETAICGSMKMVDLSSVERCLNNLSGEITLSDEILSKAYSPVCRMVEMK